MKNNVVNGKKGKKGIELLKKGKKFQKIKTKEKSEFFFSFKKEIIFYTLLLLSYILSYIYFDIS